MTTSFSQKLKNRLILYFRNQGYEITEKQAEEYLHSMADLYCLVSESIEKNQRSPKKEKESGGAAF